MVQKDKPGVSRQEVIYGDLVFTRYCAKFTFLFIWKYETDRAFIYIHVPLQFSYVI